MRSDSGEPKESRSGAWDKEPVLRATLDAIPDGVLAVDDGGRVIFANRQFAKMWRIPPDLMETGSDDELLTFVVDQLVDPEGFMKKVRELYASFHESLDELRFHDGRVFERHSMPLVRGTGLAGRVWSFRDITEAVAAQRELEKSRERYTMAASAGRIGVWSYRPEDGGFYCDPNLKALLGYEPTELSDRGADWVRLIHPDDLERARQTVVRHIQDRAPFFEIEHRAFRKDGSVYWFLTRGSVVRGAQEIIERAVGTCVDITQRKVVEQQLGASEDRYRFLVENSPGIICELSALGRILYVNRPLGGHSPSQTAGTYFREYLVPAHQARFQESLDEARRNSRNSYCEVTIGGPESEIDWGVYVCPLADNDTGAKFVVIGADITERKQAEQSRRDLESRILHAQKFESLGLLAGGIAHDFNNFLMAIMGNASLAREDLPQNSPAHESLGEIEKVARNAAELCGALLAYSGKAKVAVSLLDVNKVLEGMGRLFQVSVSKKVRIEYRFSEKLPPVQADAAQLRQVIMNLVTNASDAIGAGNGIITISTRLESRGVPPLPAARGAGECDKGTCVCVEVRDNGCGMDAATRERIFDPFYTTKNTGRGLGLAAVQGIMRAHKGEIAVESEVGKGSAFFIYLPAAAQGLDTQVAETAAHVAWRGKGAVLLVEDEEDVRKVTGQMLRRLGFKVFTAKNGAEALKAFQKRARHAVCVLLDLSMPQKDGAETFAALRAIRQDVRVILMSGYSEQEATRGLHENGLGGFIQKPFSADDLAAKLRAVLKDV